jgi:nitric oxide reductase NorE protein
MHDPMGGLFTDPFQGTVEGEAIHDAAQRRRKPPRGRIPGESGIWVFVAGDMLSFSLIFGVIVSGRMDYPAVFEHGRQTLHVGIGTFNTLLLLVGSLLAVRGMRALRTGHSDRASLLFKLTALCGLGFAVNKGIEYSMLIGEGHGITQNPFYGYYYLSTLLHLFHLLLGTAGMIIAARIAKRAYKTARDLKLCEVFTTFWHLVDLLWVVLFPLLYLVRI